MNSINHPRILLIDDDLKVCDTFSQFFSNCGWNVQIEHDGNAGLNAACSNNFDIVFTDLLIPSISGHEIIRKIRSAKPNQPVMVISDEATINDALEALRSGAIDFFMKPVDYASLKNSIEYLVKNSKESAFEDLSFQRINRQETDHIFESADLIDGHYSLPIFTKLFNSGKIDKSTKLQLILAFQEAVTNSFEHGNLGLESKLKEIFNENGVDLFLLTKKERLSNPIYSDKKITIKTIYEVDKLTIIIRDEGKGFSPPPSDRSSRLVTESEFLPYGRGTMILNSVLDEITYSSNGTEITLVKKYNPPTKYLAAPMVLTLIRK